MRSLWGEGRLPYGLADGRAEGTVALDWLKFDKIEQIPPARPTPYC
jgi:hypothetical protein